MDIIDLTNIAVTECGHMFHSKCIFKNLDHRTECPMCRADLVERPEESDNESNDGDWSSDDDDDDDDESDGENENGEEGSEEAGVTLEQLERKLVQLGYTMTDVLFMMLVVRVGNIKNKERYTEMFQDKFTDSIDGIMDGTIAVDYRDSRTYAQVLMERAM